MKRIVKLSGLPEGLKIFLADRESDWIERKHRKFTEKFRGDYALEVDGKTGEEFKCFVRTTSLRWCILINQLNIAGIDVTGKGQEVPSRGLFRIWFLRPVRIWFLIHGRGADYKGGGVWTNNVWEEETRITNIS